MATLNNDSVTTLAHTVVIEPVKGAVPLNLRELWEYRDLIWFFLARDIKGRYRQMALGPLWLVMGPLLNMILYSIMFGQVAKLPSEGVPYPLFIYSALLPWTLFASALTAASNSLLGYRDLIAKVYFPRLSIPIVGVLAAVVDFAVSFVILLVMMMVYGFWPGAGFWCLPFSLLLAGMTGLAVGLWWASWIVHYRDLATVLSYLVRVWMFASPVVYASSFVPEHWRFFYRFNPMTNVIESFRYGLLGVGQYSGTLMLLSFCVVTLLLIGGAYHFRKTERSIVDIA
jgi:lipopolysaccharide transport system permease protein